MDLSFISRHCVKSYFATGGTRFWMRCETEFKAVYGYGRPCANIQKRNMLSGDWAKLLCGYLHMFMVKITDVVSFQHCIL